MLSAWNSRNRDAGVLRERWCHVCFRRERFSNWDAARDVLSTESCFYTECHCESEECDRELATASQVLRRSRSVPNCVRLATESEVGRLDELMQWLDHRISAVEGHVLAILPGLPNGEQEWELYHRAVEASESLFTAVLHRLTTPSTFKGWDPVSSLPQQRRSARERFLRSRGANDNHPRKAGSVGPWYKIQQEMFTLIKHGCSGRLDHILYSVDEGRHFYRNGYRNQYVMSRASNRPTLLEYAIAKNQYECAIVLLKWCPTAAWLDGSASDQRKVFSCTALLDPKSALKFRQLLLWYGALGAAPTECRKGALRFKAERDLVHTIKQTWPQKCAKQIRDIIPHLPRELISILLEHAHPLPSFPILST
jgi:hypothetical protein